jgi:hypothetical protein
MCVVGAWAVFLLCAQIDHEGHVIDIAKNLGKLSIIEQEFKVAERAEQQRLREEEEMRVCCRSAAASGGLAAVEGSKRGAGRGSDTNTGCGGGRDGS